MSEAKLVEKDGGLAPDGEGWFVVNAARSPWYGNTQFGSAVMFENRAAARFQQVGVNVHALWPGQPSCHYHSENLQEDFLVLSGECLLLVEEEERRLKAWDFFHCSPGTRHVFVGAGDGPCFILMLGARRQDGTVNYPVSQLALEHKAGVTEETDDPRVSYAKVTPWGPVVAPSLPKLSG